MTHLASVVVCDLDVESIPILESEADAPLIVDCDRILAVSIPGELVQSVSGRHPQLADATREIDVLNLSPCPPQDLRRQSARPPRREELLSVSVCERPDHEHSVTRHVTSVQRQLEALAKRLPWPSNVWIGVSVESADYAYRIEHLRHVPASTRFVSFEPLLADVGELDLEGIHWAIVGGESGPGARPMQPEWALALRDQCVRQSVPFFFKQWGGVHKKKAGRILDGRVWDEYPVARVRAVAR
jgi:hypothetical protein